MVVPAGIINIMMMMGVEQAVEMNGHAVVRGVVGIGASESPQQLLPKHERQRMFSLCMNRVMRNDNYFLKFFSGVVQLVVQVVVKFSQHAGVLSLRSRLFYDEAVSINKNDSCFSVIKFSRHRAGASV